MAVILVGLGLISALATIQLCLSLLLIQSGEELQLSRQRQIVWRELEREKKKQKKS